MDEGSGIRMKTESYVAVVYGVCKWKREAVNYKHTFHRRCCVRCGYKYRHTFDVPDRERNREK